MRRRIVWFMACAVAGSLLAVPGLAAAHTTESIAETGGMSLDLALPGVGLVFNVALDDFGNIDSVEVLDPTLDPAPESAAHRARFELEEDGTRVSVDARKSKLRSKIKTGALTDLLGDHQWSAVLFPEASDAATTVNFTIGEDLDGDPTITMGAIENLPAGATYEIKPEDDEDDEVEVKVVFMLDGVTKGLKIEIEVEEEDGDDGDDSEMTATLKIELRAKDRQRLQEATIDPLVGPRVWNGILCDGTMVEVGYEIGADGTVMLGEVSFNGEPAEEGFEAKQRDHGFELRFEGSKAKVRVKLSEKDDGTWQLKVDSRTTEKCKHDDDSEDMRPDKREKDRDKEEHEEDDG